jgi:hypothetical protein
MEPEASAETPKDRKISDTERLAVLEDVFYLGYTKSERITIYKNEQEDKEINVVFRSLTPLELRDVFEASSRFESYPAQSITERLETLARSIVTINNMPLILDEKERSDFNEKHKKDPTPLDQARIILLDKIQSPYVIDALYEAYSDFLKSISEHFEEVKKKLKNPSSSS